MQLLCIIALYNKNNTTNCIILMEDKQQTKKPKPILLDAHNLPCEILIATVDEISK